MLDAGGLADVVLVTRCRDRHLLSLLCHRLCNRGIVCFWLRMDQAAVVETGSFFSDVAGNLLEVVALLGSCSLCYFTAAAFSSMNGSCGLADFQSSNH